MEKEILRKLHEMELRYKRMKLSFIALISMIVVGVFSLAFTKTDKFELIRTKGIIIEDENGKDRILIGAPLPYSKDRVRTDTNLVKKYFASEINPKDPKKYMEWYKKYRQILNSDVIHMRRADGRDWDGILHANPSVKEKGLFMLYNPLKESITRTIKIPMYYTGLTRIARIREKEGGAQSYKLNRDFTVDYTFTLPAEGYSWFVIE